MSRPSYRVVMVNQGGGAPTELARAKVDHITWELNSWGEAVYRLPTLDPQAANATLLLQREVQIWRDGVLVFWGIPVAWRADREQAQFTAYGLLWYFSRRNFGPVYSNAMVPMLARGSFEGGASIISGWSITAGATATAVTTRRYTGSRCVRLTGGGNPSTLYYIAQGPTFPTPARIKPLTFTLSAWCFPESISAYPFQDRGLELQLTSGGVVTQQWALLNANVPSNQWTRLEIQLVAPANATGSLIVALFAPTSGSVCWDQVRLTYEQKTGAIEGEDWVDDYLRRIFNYGAGLTGGGSAGTGYGTVDQKSWWGAPVLKSPLGMNFNGLTVAAGSVPVDTFWDHENRGNIYDAMSEVWKRDKADVEITWNDLGTTRGLTPFVPRKGSLKRALAFDLGRNITAFSYDVDGRQSGNDITVIGRNSGNTKEVGQAGGPTPATLGGVQFESVLTPPQETDGQGLIDQAVTAERQLHAPVILPTLTVRAAGLLDATEVGGPLTVGDVVPVRMDYGAVQENDLRRVVKMTLTPGAEETLAVVVNAVA